MPSFRLTVYLFVLSKVEIVMSKIVIKRKVANKGFYKRQTGLEQKVEQVAKEISAQGAIDIPQLAAGDSVKVHVRIKEGEKERIQIFEGLVIALSNVKINRTFTVRKVSHGVGVERIFQVRSPKIAKVEIVSQGKVRRAKLYFIREREGRAAKLEKANDGRVVLNKESSKS